MVSARPRRSFIDYAMAHGAGLGGVPTPAPLPVVTLNPAPPPTVFANSPTMLERALGGAQPRPAPLPAAPNAPAMIPTGADPIQRAGNELATMVAGTHDPTVSSPAQALRAVATAPQAVLMGADLPRQAVTSHEGDEFIHDISRNNEWSVIMTVMNNLGALNAPTGVMTQRPESERAIVPDNFAFGGGSVLGGLPIPMAQSKTIDQLTQEYAAFMSQQDPATQRAVWDQFQKWHDQKRTEYYTPEGDLKKVVSFEIWQALNYDKALDVYLHGWQKPAAPIPQADGTSAAPQVNDNPKFTGGQAVWEAYVNELDPAQRILVDVQHDPTVIMGGIGKGAAEVGAGVAERGLPGLGRALTGFGATTDLIANAPFGGSSLLPGAATADRGAARRIGRAAAGMPGVGNVVQATDTGVRAAARNYERVVNRIGFREDPFEAEKRRPTYQFADEMRAIDALTPGQTAADDAARAAARQQQLRIMVPKPGAPIGKWGTAEDGARSLYVDANHPDVRVAQRQQQQGRVTVESRDVEVWNTDTGTWDTVASHPITGGGVTAAKATTAALRDATAAIDTRFREVGAGPGTGVYETSWDGAGLHDLRGIVNDTRITGNQDINQDALTRLRQKIEENLADTPIPDTPTATTTLVLTDDELDAAKDAITAAGGRTMTPIQTPPMSQATLAQPPPAIEQAPLPTPPPGRAIEQALPPLPPREPRIEQTTLPAPPPQAGIEQPRLSGAAAVPEAVQPLEPPVAAGLPAAPDTTPATIRVGGAPDEKGIGANAYRRLLDAATKQGDTDLADALGTFTNVNRNFEGELTADQSQRLASLARTRETDGGALLPESRAGRLQPGGHSAQSTNRELRRVANNLAPPTAITPAEVVPPTPAIAAPEVPPTPEVSKSVAITTNIREKARASTRIPDDLKAKFEGLPERKRAGGQVVDVELSRSEIDLLNSLTGPNAKRDMSRAIREWDAAPEVAPIAPEPPPSAAPTPESPPAPTQQEIPVREEAPVEAPPPPGRAGMTPVQRIRHDITKEQYPGRPIAYALPNGEFQLLDEHAPYGSTEVARFSGGDRTPVSSFTGTREEILANAPDAVFVDPARGFRATNADNTFVPPPVDGRDFYPEGVRPDIDPARSGTSAPIDAPRLEPVLAPFREALLKAAPDPETSDIVQRGLDETRDMYLGMTDAGYRAGKEKAVNHEIKGALTLARGIVATMEDVADNGGVLGRMPEIAYGAGRAMKDTTHGDFDWIMRSVFGVSRESKRGVSGFFTQGGERGAKETGSGSATRFIIDRINQLTARGEAERADQFRGLLSEVEELRRRYIDLLGRQSGTDYYAGIGGPTAQRIGGAIGQGIAAAGRPLRDVATGGPQVPGPETLPFLPDTANKLNLLSADARTAADFTWENHPDFAGQSSFTVREEVLYQARQDIAEYRQLASQGTTLPTPRRVKRNGKNVLEYPAGMSDDQKRMKDITLKYQPIMPLGETLDTADPGQIGERAFMREFLIENGKITQGQDPTNWLFGFGRWMIGLHRDVNAASAQIVLHDPTNFRYMLMNFFGNPTLLAARYPKAAVRSLFGTGARTAYGRYSTGFSPVSTILRSNPNLKTGFEMHAAEMGMAVPREVLIDEKYSHEKAAKGVRNLMERIGLGKYAGVAEPFDRGARLHIGMESHQRGAGWWSRSEERVAEAWADTRPAVDAYLRSAGFGENALADMEQEMPRTFGAVRLYDAVYRAANNTGKSAEDAVKLAKGAYDLWVTPSRNASYKQAVADIGGPMPLNRRTPVDDKLGLIAPFTFWNMRISKYLLEELYGSPFRMAAMERYQDWAEDYQRNNPDMPGFLRGYIHITQTPFGMFLAANPVALLLTQAFLDDQVNREGVNRTMWDEVTDAVGSGIGVSPMPNVQFFVQALGFSRDKQVRLPFMTPPSVRTFGAMIDYLSVLTGGEGGIPLNQKFWTWVSQNINEVSRRVLPGAERSYLVDPDLIRQNATHAMLIQDHPELLDDLDQANEVMGDDDHPWMRAAWTKAAGGKLFTQGFNQVSPVLARAVNPTTSTLSNALAEQGVVNDIQAQAVSDVEAQSAALAPTVPLGTSATSPGGQPVGTADWRSDPRWANHLTGGPAPDVQSRSRADDLYLENDVIGSTPEFRRILTAEQQYHDVGSPLEQQTYADWNAIAYGTPMRTVDMGGGRVYAPADVLALPEEERKVLADEWVMTHAALDGTPLVPILESYRMQRDAFAASNPEWTAYDEWRDGIRNSVEAGSKPNLLEWGRQEAERNPNFKRHYDDVLYRLQTGEYDQERAEGKMLSVDAYLADLNIQQNVTDPAIIPAASASGNGSGGGLTEEQIFATVQRAMNTGSAYNPAEAIRQDMQSYSRDLMTTNTFLAQIGFQNVRWESADAGMRRMMEPLFDQYGIPKPALGPDTQAYLTWAQSHPDGTPEQFLQERQQQLIGVMTTGLPQPTPAAVR